MRHKNYDFGLKIDSHNIPKTKCTNNLGVHMDNISDKLRRKNNKQSQAKTETHSTTCWSHLGKFTRYNEHHLQDV